MHLNKKEWPTGLDTMKSTKQKERDKVQSGQKVCIRGGGVRQKLKWLRLLKKLCLLKAPNNSCFAFSCLGLFSQNPATLN